MEGADIKASLAFGTGTPLLRVDMGLASILGLVSNVLRTVWLVVYEWVWNWSTQLRRQLADYHIEEERCVVKTECGYIRGKSFVFTEKNGDQRRVNAYLGVPFATVGDYEERFKVEERQICIKAA